jgi:hypothetical protein
MATVRISKELRSMIVQAARNKMQPAKARAEQSFDRTRWGDYVYDNIFPTEDIAKVKALPKYWFITIKEIRVMNVGHTKLGLSLPLSAPSPWPVGAANTPRLTQLYGPSNTIGPAIALDSNSDVWVELEAAAITYQSIVLAAEERNNQFIDSVNKLLDTYTTLAPALKAWPALWELVPDEYKDRHKKVVAKATRETLTPAVDLTSMTAVIAAAKMLGQ